MASTAADGKWALDTPPPVEHRFLGLDKRLIRPTLGILLIQIILAGVLPAINDSIEAEEFASGTVLELNRGFTFVPADGWSSVEVPKPGAPTLTIFRDAVTFTISVGEFDGSPQDLLDELVEEYDGDFKVKGDPQVFALGEALRGAGVEITTEANSGMVVGLISEVESPTGRVLAVTVRVESPQGEDISGYLEEVAAMLASIRVPQSGEDA